MNVPVLIFGFLWFFWKRLYRQGIILFVISLPLTIYIFLIRIDIFLDLFGFYRFDPEIVIWFPALYLPNLIFSLFGDKWYEDKLEKRKPPKLGNIDRVVVVFLAGFFYLFLFALIIPFFIGPLHR